MQGEIWNYRGSLTDEWRLRKEATGMTMDALMKLGIETAEKAKAEEKATQEAGK